MNITNRSYYFPPSVCLIASLSQQSAPQQLPPAWCLHQPHKHKGNRPSSTQGYLEMFYPFETPVQQHFCTPALSGLVSPALLTAATHSLLRRQCLSDELPRPAAIASRRCIPSCDILSRSWFVAIIFPLTRGVFSSQRFSYISPSPAIPPEIIQCNLFHPCPIVASNST